MRRKFLSITIILSSLFFTNVLCADVVPYKGIEKLNLPHDMELQVVTGKDFDFVDEEGARRFWKTTLTLSKQGKTVWQKTHNEDKEERWVYGNIVPIKKGKYYSDLNGDGFVEVAVLPWDFGMAAIRIVEIYTVRHDELIKYGEGRFNFEFGPKVISITKNNFEIK